MIQIENHFFNVIKEKPTTIDRTHESILRSWNILAHVKIMLDRGDSKESIKDFISFVESPAESDFKLVDYTFKKDLFKTKTEIGSLKTEA